MNVGSLFSGIGGFDLGLERAGHRIVFQCEADPYRRRVLARHWPGVPCFEDVRLVGYSRNGGQGKRQAEHERTGGGADGFDPSRPDGVQLLCGGFPCQDLSVAGRRAGLAGERSGLFFEFARVADVVLPDGGWVLIENVPGLLSSPGRDKETGIDRTGRDFAIVLATLAEVGFHDLAWRVLDSRYFGVPQRRRRVFILARRSRGRSASEVLLEPESGGGDFEAGRETRKGVAGSVADGAKTARSLTASERWDGETEDFVSALDRRQGGADDNDAQAGHIVPALVSRSSRGRPTPLAAGFNTDGHIVAHTLRSEGFDASEDGTGRGTPLVPDPTGFRSRMAGPAQRRLSEGGDGQEIDADGGRTPPGLPGRMDVGAFHVTQEPIYEPDGTPALGSNAYLGTTASGEGTGRSAFDPRPDGPRYAACGDAVTVNVAYWIGKRLMDYAD